MLIIRTGSSENSRGLRDKWWSRLSAVRARRDFVVAVAKIL